MGPAGRRQAGVYRRRRLVLLGVVSLLVVLPWCAATRSGGGDEDDRAGERSAMTATSQPGGTTACRAAAAELSVRQRLALLTMEGVDGDDPDAVEAVLARADRPGGVFVRSGEQVWDDGTLVDRAPGGLPLLVAVDDEGGRVDPLGGVLPELGAAASRADVAPADAVAAAEARGGQLLDLGINVVLAPVVDVGEGGGIGDRSFSSDPDVVRVAAGAWAQGLREAGVLPVLKHFPGEGRGSGDPHDEVITTPVLEQLRTVDLKPYEQLLHEGPVGVMIGHLDVPGLTAAGVPASLSPAAVGLLRGAYDFDGLVVTDDLVGMAAVRDRFALPDAAERALAAGVDLLLLSDRADVGPVLDHLEAAVAAGRIPVPRVDRALDRVLTAGGCP